MINKRGLSNVVATVLIVLLALAAVMIVWSFIKPTIEDAGTTVNLRQKCINAEVRPVECTVGDPSVAKVELRNGDSVVAILAVLEKADKTQVSARTSGVLTKFAATLVDLTPVAGDVLKVAAIVGDDAGNEETCDLGIVTLDCTGAA
ncbi:MAG: archaellin/type IV pilin N-terminal domain-containing protein [archaeon]